jgi:hypothetical protein
MDDSGKLNRNEKYCVYGGVVFFSKKEQQEFMIRYKAIVKDTRCKYCNQSECNLNCPELKHSMLHPSDRRRFINFLKRFYLFGVIINNSKVYENIIETEPSRRRFIDYAIKRSIKEILRRLIKDKRIDPDSPLDMIINIDEQSTKSNGYYTLRDGIIEELIHGIQNFNYSTRFEPILNNDFKLTIHYKKSDKHFEIQASDLIAGNIRRIMLESEGDLFMIEQRLRFLNFKMFLPA